MLHISTEEQGDTTLVKFDGVIDEEAPLDATAHMGFKKIVYDLQDLRGINSVGIKHWIAYTSKLRDAGTTMTFVNCPTIFIDQMALLPDFIPDWSTVKTFYAPYVCDECAHEWEEIFAKEDLAQTGYPERDCPECQAKGNVDDLADEFVLLAEKLGNAA